MVRDVMRDITSLVLFTLVASLNFEILHCSSILRSSLSSPQPSSSSSSPLILLTPSRAYSTRASMTTVVMGALETPSPNIPVCDVTTDAPFQDRCRQRSSSSSSSSDSGFSHSASSSSSSSSSPPLWRRSLRQPSSSSSLTTSSSSSSSPASTAPTSTSSLSTEPSLLSINISSSGLPRPLPTNVFHLSSPQKQLYTSDVYAGAMATRKTSGGGGDEDKLRFEASERLSKRTRNASGITFMFRNIAIAATPTTKTAVARANFVHNRLPNEGRVSSAPSARRKNHRKAYSNAHSSDKQVVKKTPCNNRRQRLRKKRETKKDIGQGQKVRVHSQQSKKGNGKNVARSNQPTNPAKGKKQHQPMVSHLLAQGLEGRIDCYFLDYDPPTSLIVWSKNSKVIEATYDTTFQNSPGHRETNHGEDGEEGQPRKSRFKVAKAGTLVIENVTIADAGNYSCSLYSPYERGKNEQKHFSVEVKEIPVFETEPLPVYQRLVGQSVTMTCAASGDPTPFITWSKIKGHFPPPTRTLADNGSLTIVGLQLSDQGTYECLALNAISTIVTTSLLVVLDQPQQSVHNVSTSSTTNSISVSWLPPLREEDDPDGPYTYDFVIVPSSLNPKTHNSGASTPSPGQRIFPVGDPGISTITVHHLLPRTKYTFSIVAISPKTSKRVASHAYEIWTKDEHGQEVLEENTNSATPPRWTTIRNSITSRSNPATTQDDLHRPAPPINVEVRWHTPEQEKPVSDESKDKRKPKGKSDNEDDDEGNDDEDDDDDEDEEDEEKDEEQKKEPLQESPGLLISWMSPMSSPLSVDMYTVEYRTVGRWVPLENPVVAPTTQLYWKRPSWGVVYYFRVVSTNNRTRTNSKPSLVVSINTTDPMSGFVEASTTGMIGFVVGSMSVFLALIAFTTSLSRLFKKRKLKQVEKKRLKQEADEASMTVNTSVGRALDGKESPLLDVRLAVDNHVIASSSNHNSIEFTTTPILETPI